MDADHFRIAALPVVSGNADFDADRAASSGTQIFPVTSAVSNRSNARASCHAWSGRCTCPGSSKSSCAPSRQAVRRSRRIGRCCGGRSSGTSDPPPVGLSLAMRSHVSLWSGPRLVFKHRRGPLLRPVARYRSRCVRPSSTFAGCHGAGV